MEYAAKASGLVSGDVKLAVGEDALTAAALFDAAEIPYARIEALSLEGYAVRVATRDGPCAFAMMGQWTQPFYDALLGAYNGAVRRALFLPETPILTAQGGYRYSEDGPAVRGEAVLHVYDNCVTLLPPDLSARRVPLCFARGLDRGDYELTLRLAAGESYTFQKLGFETAPFADTVEGNLRKLFEKTVASVTEIDPSLTAAQASRVARLMPEGAAAPIGQLHAIAPSFVSALEGSLAQTRAAESCRVFAELNDPARIWVGLRKDEGAEDSLLWLIAPSPDGRFAAVEFANDDAATYIYGTGGDFDGFAHKLNRALEAIGFARDAIRLSDEELRKPQYAHYLMAVGRTAALRFVRKNYTGRIIHSSPDAWKRGLQAAWRNNS